MTGEHRFYTNLAAWWPLISPPADYEEEAVFIAERFEEAPIAVREVLELGSGGGHNAYHLHRRYAMTLVDLSADMLEVSRALNPDCEHVRGDMRTLHLDRMFDAVLVHDAIDYMATEADLRSAFETVFVHCRPGGVAVLLPDHLAETFEPSTSHGGTDAPDGRGIRYLEWSRRPDTAGTWIETDYVFLLRDPSGAVEVEHETHRTGLFPRQTWIDGLTGVGFDVRVVPDDFDREVFVCQRPT